MIGTTFEEFKHYLKTNRKVEFSYQNAVYTIEPGGANETIRYSIWKSHPGADRADCICEYCASPSVTSDDAAIDDFLSTPCFNGKTFMDIEKEVTVDVIF